MIFERFEISRSGTTFQNDLQGVDSDSRKGPDNYLSGAEWERICGMERNRAEWGGMERNEAEWSGMEDPANGTEWSEFRVRLTDHFEV